MIPRTYVQMCKTAADSYRAHSEDLETEDPLLLTHIAESVSATFSERPFHRNHGPEKMRKILYENIIQVSVLYVFAHTVSAHAHAHTHKTQLTFPCKSLYPYACQQLIWNKVGMHSVGKRQFSTNVLKTTGYSHTPKKTLSQNVHTRPWV